MSKPVVPTNVETFFDDIIVSKTDLKGRITYVNGTFCKVSGYDRRALLGQPHNMIRHPDMPRAVFKLLWDTIASGQEVFAYVKNICHGGDHYWVFAHVTPSRDGAGNIVGYHSNRRPPDRAVLENTVIPLYAELLAEEARQQNGKEAVAAGYRKMIEFVNRRKMPYDQLVFSL